MRKKLQKVINYHNESCQRKKEIGIISVAKDMTVEIISTLKHSVSKA